MEEFKDRIIAIVLLDPSPAPDDVEKVLEDVPARALHVILDLGQVEYLSNDVIAFFLQLHKKLERIGKVVVVCSVQEHVAEKLYLLGILDNILPGFLTHKEAEEWLLDLEMQTC